MNPQSMTGYGKGSAGNFRVEIRSSNHKNLDVSINAPNYLFSYDPEIRKKIKEKLSRGRIEIFIPRIESINVRLKVNTTLAWAYHDALLSLRDELGLSDEVTLKDVTGHKDIFLMDEPEIDSSELFNALDIAIEDLKKARSIEGQSLFEDIDKRVEIIRKYTDDVEKKRNEISSGAREKLHDRLKEMLGGVAIDETRLIQETAIMVERADITEEIVRIKSHLDNLDKIMKSGEAIGKKIDFFIQELRREINTIGSKSQDVEIATDVIEMKHELEKIKEQVQNLQ